MRQLGKRLRDRSASDEDFSLLDDFRRSRDPDLMNTAQALSKELAASNIDHVIAGRSKRTKSIIRKLSRPQNKGMDLSRMADLVGLRIIVKDRADQNSVVDSLREAFPNSRVIDDRDGGDHYHRLHVIYAASTGPLEIQVRTLRQHLWADESETFGEKVKGGAAIGEKEKKEYLEELSARVREIEQGDLNLGNVSLTSRLGKERDPFRFGYRAMRDAFEEVNATRITTPATNTFLCVYDAQANEITRQDEYKIAERDQALKEYERLSREHIESDRYDVFILNCATSDGVKVTHFRIYSAL